MALDDIKQSVEQNLAKAYEKALDKGATEPAAKNLENLESTIDSIQGGGENDVITVDELPEEDVDSAKVYKTNTIENQLVMYYTGSKPIPFKNIVNVTQVLVNDIHSVTTPQVDEPFVYVDTSSGIGYLYTNENENVVQMTVGQIMDLPDKGYIEHLDETTIVESGIYYTPLEVTEYGIPNNDTYDNRQVKKYIHVDGEIGYQWRKMEVVSGGTNITKNGHYNVTPYETLDVNVPSSEPNLIAKEVNENGKYNASDDGVDGYSSINVNVASGGDLTVEQRTKAELNFSEGNIEILPNFSEGGVLDLSKDIGVSEDDGTGSYDSETGYYKFYIPNSNSVDIYAKIQFVVPKDGDVVFDLYAQEGSSYNLKWIAVSNLDTVMIKQHTRPAEDAVYSLTNGTAGVKIDAVVTFHNVPAGEHFVMVNAGAVTSSSLELQIRGITVPENISDAGALSKLTLLKPASLKPENIATDKVVMGIKGISPTMVMAVNDGVSEILDTGAVTSIRPYAFYRHTTVTKVSFPECATIGISAFQSCSQLSSVDFPKCQYIGSSAFANCTKLTNVSFPSVLSLGSEIWRGAPISTVYLPECISVGQGFRNATAIKEIDLPKLTSASASYAFGAMNNLVSANLPECSILGSFAFADCRSLTYLNIPKLTSLSGLAHFTGCYKLPYFNIGNISSITQNMFAYCSALSSVDADNVTYVGTQAFYFCVTLPSINLPQCSVVSASAFANCSALTTINIPVCQQIGSYTFSYCSSLAKIDLPVVSSIGSRAFHGCSRMSAIIIGSSSCRLGSTDVFQQTPMSNSTYLGNFGSIYVPADYVDYYKTSQYWSTYSSRITSIENLPAE